MSDNTNKITRVLGIVAYLGWPGIIISAIMGKEDVKVKYRVNDSIHFHLMMLIGGIICNVEALQCIGIPVSTYAYAGCIVGILCSFCKNNTRLWLPKRFYEPKILEVDDSSDT